MKTVWVIWLAAFLGVGFAQNEFLNANESDLYDKWVVAFTNTIKPLSKFDKPISCDPRVPFNLARCFAESDLVLECSLAPLLMPNPFSLIGEIDNVTSVYKGLLPNIHCAGDLPLNTRKFVMFDAQHTGRLGFCHLDRRKTSKYLLFLNCVDDREKTARGYNVLEGQVYKINRIWHGAISTSKVKFDVTARNYFLRNDRYRALRFNSSDVKYLVSLLSLIEKNTAGLALLKLEREALKIAIGDRKGSDKNINVLALNDILESSIGEMAKGTRVFSILEAAQNLPSIEARLKFLKLLFDDAIELQTVGKEKVKKRANENDGININVEKRK